MKACGDFYPATEDGSTGVKGTVIDAIVENKLEADVIYAVYEEMVVSQSYRFGVEYTRTNGETIQYLASSEVTFTDNANQNDYEYIISETEDGTQTTKEQKED